MKIAPINLQSQAIRASRWHPLLVGLTILPKTLQKSVSAVQENLRRTDARHIFHPAATYHITLKPVGSLGVQVNRKDLDRIKDAFHRVTSEFQALEVALEGLAVFPDVVYAKVTDGKKDIIKLNKALAESLGDLAVQGEYEGDRMIPHVTLATFTTPAIGNLLADVKRADHLVIGRMTLNRVHLVTAYLNRYYGSESGRAKAFRKVEVFQLKAF
jgi:2'-5' RNA ligase